VTQRLDETFAIEGGNICAKFECMRLPGTPARMEDAILAGVAMTRRVPPIMFSDEFFVRTSCNWLGFSCRLHRERFPPFSAPPFVRGPHHSISIHDVVPHRHCHVGFAVKNACCHFHRPAGNDLTDECYSSPPALLRPTTYIETQIHFLEISMQGHRYAHQPGFKKKETDYAQKCFALVKVEFRSIWNIRSD
jgi:hypothetical protein